MQGRDGDAPSAGVRPTARGLHSLTLELNLSTFGKHPRVKLGCKEDQTAQVEREMITSVSPYRPPTPQMAASCSSHRLMAATV